MNIDIASTFPFGDAQALRQFMLDHNTVHLAESQALTAKFGGVYSTIGLMDELAEEAWIEMMETGEGSVSPALKAWLETHASMHNQTYQTINGVGSTAPDLSQVDFSKPDQFYTWMLVHQEMHDFEQGALQLQ